MLNRIIMTGRLCADPEMRHTQSGVAVCSFRIANERDYAKDGEKETDFFDVVAWRSTADFISKYFTKGRLITVDGRMQTRPWTDREGNKRTAYEVLVDNAYFGDSKRESSDSADHGWGYDGEQFSDAYNNDNTPAPGGVSGDFAPDFD